jgi:ABC-type multidrug transport system fused ATPase/permease subunit
MKDIHTLKKYFSPYTKGLVIIITLSLFCGLFEAVSLGVLVPLINIIATNEEPTGNLWTALKTFFGFFNIELNFTVLLIALSIVFLTGQALIFLKQTLQIKLRFEFVLDIKKQVFSQLMYTDISYHYDKKIGQFLDTILVETERAGSGFYVITEIFSNTFLILVYILMLTYISLYLTCICFFTALVMLFFVNKLLENSKIFGIKIVDSNTVINEFTTERLGLLKLLKANSSEDTEADLFSKIADKFREVNTKFVINGAKIELVFQSIMFIVAIIILYLSMNVFYLSAGLIAVFLFTLIRLTTPLRGINNQRHELAGLMASLLNVDKVLKESQKSTTIIDGKRVYTGIQSSIRVKNLSFSYFPDTPILHGIDLLIKKNEMVALVGPSGGGKSTLVDLLMRLIDPKEGAIEVDTINLKDFNVKSYHAKVGLVSQDIFIFNDSVLSNIAYGADTISLERTQEAAKIAYAHEFIEQLPQGYDSPLGDRGVKLSGGQKQRIALARAIYKNPDILILDEATSALDTESEKIIQSSINAIKHKYTIIVVAHRLSTIQDADKIVVIEGGKIIESGTHEELLLKNGTYAKYYFMQYEKRAL